MKNLLSIRLFLREGGANKKEKEEKKSIQKADDWSWTYTPHGSSLHSFLDIGFISR